MRESSPHRGGVGLDWKNTSWQDNGVIIEEWISAFESCRY